MLIGAALVGLYFMIFGGGGDPAGKVFDTIEDRLADHVKDKARRKTAGGVLDEMRKTREGTFGKVEGLALRLSKAHAGHATPRAETEKILEELDAVRRESWAKQVDARFKLKGTLTREEWSALFPKPGR